MGPDYRLERDEEISRPSKDERAVLDGGDSVVPEGTNIFNEVVFPALKRWAIFRRCPVRLAVLWFF